MDIEAKLNQRIVREFTALEKDITVLEPRARGRVTDRLEEEFAKLTTRLKAGSKVEKIA